MQASRVLPVALKGLEEGPYKGLVDEAHLLKQLEWCAQAGSLFVATDKDEPVGFFAATFLPSHMILGRVPCAMELAWYVLPEHRHKGHGYALLVAFESWATNLGCKYLFLGKKRKGYLPLEQTYWKAI